MHVHIAWVRKFELLPRLPSRNAADFCPVVLRGLARSPSAHPETRPIFRGDESSGGCSCVRQVAGVGRDLGKRAVAGPWSARADPAAPAISVARSNSMIFEDAATGSAHRSTGIECVQHTAVLV